MEWAKQDLNSAKEWLKNHEHKSRYSAMSSMISNLSKEDFKQAAQLHQEFTEWAKNQEPDSNESLENAGRDLVRSWTQNDRDEALAWIDSLPASETKDSMISSAISQIGSQLPEKARELANTLPPGELRASTISKLVRDLKQQDNQAQAFETSQLLLDDQLRLTTTEDLLKRLRYHHQDVALKLLDRANIPEADRKRIRETLE